MKAIPYQSRSLRRETVTLHGRLNLGATGAITTQTKQRFSGFVVARTGVGTYTITLSDVYSELLALRAVLIGANATYPSTAGREPFITSDLTTTTKVITVKFINSTDLGGAVAEIEDSAKVLLSLDLAQSPSEVG